MVGLVMSGRWPLGGLQGVEWAAGRWSYRRALQGEKLDPAAPKRGSGFAQWGLDCEEVQGNTGCGEEQGVRDFSRVVEELSNSKNHSKNIHNLFMMIPVFHRETKDYLKKMAGGGGGGDASGSKLAFEELWLVETLLRLHMGCTHTLSNRVDITLPTPGTTGLQEELLPTDHCLKQIWFSMGQGSRVRGNEQYAMIDVEDNPLLVETPGKSRGGLLTQPLSISNLLIVGSISHQQCLVPCYMNGCKLSFITLTLIDFRAIIFLSENLSVRKNTTLHDDNNSPKFIQTWQPTIVVFSNVKNSKFKKSVLLFLCSFYLFSFFIKLMARNHQVLLEEQTLRLNLTLVLLCRFWVIYGFPRNIFFQIFL
ncbi:hypothetical protein VP01_5343g1 [Puccinia sorghi]|uniref:Uncharacterized protein n=1 Tax=Puccinia sorghi TaxID=27349 RepID=A0A0L6UK39_9BASI|nr:hypothetical protein VP01_5343g1 [Puccinia sorghi]